jgi:hypothetical protein
MLYQFSIVTVRVISDTILNYNRPKTIVDNIFLEWSKKYFFYY